jgi:large subunit ribosomal protein L4
MTSAPLEVRSADGTVTGTVQLDPDLFGVQPNVPLLHQVVTAQLAAARSGTQSTKTRAEVAGGGAKPYRQKGTGRARQGSTRAPHYAGGGVALGPKPRSYRQRTPRKMVQLALRGALSDRAGAGQVAVVESWDWQIPSTKDAQAALRALGLSGRVLVVLSREDELAYKSFRNLPGVDLVLVPELAAYDVLCSDWVVFTRRTLPGQSTWGERPAGAPDAKSTEARVSPAEEPATPEDAAPEAVGAEDGSSSEDADLEGPTDLGPDDAEADELATEDMAELRRLDAEDADTGDADTGDAGGGHETEEEED